MVKPKINTITDQFIKVVCSRLADNKQVRRSLPTWGRVHIDRQLPFLCIYRRKETTENSLSDGLITGEASYITAIDKRTQHKQLSNLVKRIAATLKENFGSFLIVEVWVSTDKNTENSSYHGNFKIFRTKETDISPTVEALERSLKKIKIRKKKSSVEVLVSSKIAPQNLPALISPSETKQLGYHIIGIEVSPIYFDEETKKVFPIIYRNLKKGFTRALQNSFFEFTRNNTPFRPPNYQSLGRRSLVKAVWDVDAQLAEINNGFDFLLQVSPVNIYSAWSTFKRNHYEKTPSFIYRPLTIDPSLAKRKLFQIPLERIEDPTLTQLFREQQMELDRKFTMLSDRGSSRFKYGSFQLYGTVDDSLLEIAKKLLSDISPRSRDESKSNTVNAEAFADRAKQELDYFREKLPDINTKIIIRNDITGLMVSHGNLLIGSRINIPETRVEALIAHEVGTHVLTFLNGKHQPLKQLYIGLSGYDELQEGLAVLSEYMVGGLTGTRLRLLAARVVAAYLLGEETSFIDVFRELNKTYGFERSTAFNITSRTFRSGGMTKDAIYLRGLVKLLEYLKSGEELEPLFIGKISAAHIAMVKELQWRKVLHSPPLIPSYFNDTTISKELNDLKNGLSLTNLIKRRTK
ncbi:MAG: DUF1704 domain-containing protein [Bacteroidales bacterium]|nr:DUF1704 domain-containing protein [Bacteroidales bacterium]